MARRIPSKCWQTRQPGKFEGKPNTLCALALHRIDNVEEYWQEIADPTGYDINSAAARKELMTLYSDTPVELRLRISLYLYTRLTENPLCDNQVIEPAGDNWWHLTCSIQDSQGLRLFLLSNAAYIKVISPSDVRVYVQGRLQQAVALYDAQD